MPATLPAFRYLPAGRAWVRASQHVNRLTRQLLRQPFHSDFRLLKSVHPRAGQVIVDVGAFEGEAIDAIRLYHPETPVLAFEPNPRRSLVLAERYGEDANLSIYACGLADREGEAVLAAPVEGGSLRDGEASIDARRVAHWGRVRSVQAKVFALDALDADVCVLKIHVNGAEASVLKGARETLTRCEPLILCAHDLEADAWLTGELGWIRAGFDGARLIPGEAGRRYAIYAGPRCEAALWRAGLLV